WEKSSRLSRTTAARSWSSRSAHRIHSFAGSSRSVTRSKCWSRRRCGNSSMPFARRSPSGTPERGRHRVYPAVASRRPDRLGVTARQRGAHFLPGRGGAPRRSRDDPARGPRGTGRHGRRVQAVARQPLRGFARRRLHRLEPGAFRRPLRFTAEEVLALTAELAGARGGKALASKLVATLPRAARPELAEESFLVGPAPSGHVEQVLAVVREAR